MLPPHFCRPAASRLREADSLVNIRQFPGSTRLVHLHPSNFTSSSRQLSLHFSNCYSSTLACPNSRSLATLRRVVWTQEKRVSTRSWFSLGASLARQIHADDMASAPNTSADKRPERSTWASAVDSFNPWGGSRSSTPVPKEPVPSPTAKQTNPRNDHSINPIYGLSAKKYPPDCPPLKVQWFHAVDASDPCCFARTL